MTLGHVVVVIFGVSCRFLGQFQPSTSRTIASLYVVANDLRSTVADRRRPSDLYVILVRVDAFRFARLARCD